MDFDKCKFWVFFPLYATFYAVYNSVRDNNIWESIGEAPKEAAYTSNALVLVFNMLFTINILNCYINDGLYEILTFSELSIFVWIVIFIIIYLIISIGAFGFSGNGHVPITTTIDSWSDRKRKNVSYFGYFYFILSFILVIITMPKYGV